jgi:hypothetical protein
LNVKCSRSVLELNVLESARRNGCETKSTKMRDVCRVIEIGGLVGGLTPASRE